MSLAQENLAKLNPQEYTILIVDDTPANLNLLTDYLEGYGFQIRVTRSGKNALNRVQHTQPDLILLDVMMPDMNGFEVCLRLKADNITKDIPIIFMTSLVETKHKIKGFEIGAADYITKPFQIKEVLARVQTHLALRRLQKQLETQNTQLQQEISERLQAEEALQRANDELEDRVKNRTIELAQANSSLKKEIAERKQTEQELGSSEDRFRHVISSISDHIYVSEITESGSFKNRYLSPHIETLTGYPYKKFKTDWSFWSSTVIHPDDRAVASRQVLHLAKGQNSEIEYRLVRADGEVIWIRDSARVQDEGASKIVYGLVSNITTHKQAQEALRESETRYRSLFERMPIGLYRSTPSGQLLDANPALLQIHRFSNREVMLTTKTSDLYVNVETRQQWQAVLERERVVRDFETQVYQHDGNIIWVRNNSWVVQDDLGQTLYYEGSVEDITKRKQTEKAIHKLAQELEKRVVNRTRELSALYDVTAVASESLDLTTTLERVLEQVLKAMRSNTGEIHLLDESKKTLRLVVQQGQPPDVVSQRDSVPLDKGLTSWVIKHNEPLIVSNMVTDPRVLQMPGLDPELAYMGVPIQARKRVLGVLGVFLKEREQSQLNVNEISLLTSIADHVGVVVESARLRQRVEQAAVVEERARLSRDLHDSVTQSIYSLTLFARWGLDLFEDGELEELKQRLIRIGETAQQALKEMRLLLYELRPAILEQDGLVGALQRRLDTVEKRAGVVILLEAEPLDKLPTALELGMYRIAQEALNNALKHAFADLVTLRVYGDDRHVNLEIEDNGKGFVQGTINAKGGLGLVSIQERVKQFGGVLTVDSSPGKGTIIKVAAEMS